MSLKLYCHHQLRRQAFCYIEYALWGSTQFSLIPHAINIFVNPFEEISHGFDIWCHQYVDLIQLYSYLYKLWNYDRETEITSDSPSLMASGKETEA